MVNPQRPQASCDGAAEPFSGPEPRIFASIEGLGPSSHHRANLRGRGACLTEPSLQVLEGRMWRCRRTSMLPVRLKHVRDKAPFPASLIYNKSDA